MKIDSLKYNGKSVRKIYQGTELVNKMNYGQSSDVFQYIKKENDAPKPYDEQYLTIEALTAGNLSLADAGSNVFNYSLDDGKTWKNLAMNQTVDVEANKKVLFKAQGLTVSSSDGIGTIKYTGNFNVYGNAMSLVYGDNFIGQNTISAYQFLGLFYQNKKLISAENLVLPSITLRPTEGFFRSGATYCYRSMFSGCASLTAAPELPATTLAGGCYRSMFYDCASLTVAPELPADTLASTSDDTGGCYAYMFHGCTSLNYIKCLATGFSPAFTACLNWVVGVSSTGTFVKNAATTGWPSSASGIPSGWTVVNA